MIKNYIIVLVVGIVLLALILLIVYPQNWLGAVAEVFDDQVIVVLFGFVCAALSVSLLVYPILDYIKTGQKRRIEVIKGFYSLFLIIEYFREFWMGRNGIPQLVQKADQGVYDDRDIGACFDQLLERDFGIGRYRFPLGILVAVALIVMFFAFIGGLSLAARLSGKPLIPPLGITVDLVSIAAIFGAYIWVTSDAILRNHHGAIHASDLSWYALRLVIAVPLGQAISMVAGTAQLPDQANAPGGTDLASGALGAPWAAFFAFVISMFSLERINQILGSIANRTLNLEAVSPAEREDLVIRLPGVDERTANLFGSEGVTTIAQVVDADPVRLSIRTALPFDYVLGLVDAGILWTYVGTKLSALREFGLKGASDVLACRDDFHSSTQLDTILDRRSAAKNTLASAEETHRVAEETLATAADTLGAAQAAVVSAGGAATPVQTQAVTTAEQAHTAATTGAAQAAADLEKAREALSQAEADLKAAVADHRELLEDIAAKTEMKVSGLGFIFMRIERNAYARFIRRLMD